MKVNIGGNRLGSGSKMKVDMRTYNRSNHNLSTIVRTTMAPGTLVPFLSLVGLPGDTFDINLDCDVMTHPTIGPLFGSYKVQLDVFTVPVRLYNGKLHNNALNIGLNMSSIKLPLIEMEASPLDITKDPDNQQINPSCIFKYLGISGLGRGTDTTLKRYFNAIPYIGYWDIYKNFYANKQEEIGAVIHNVPNSTAKSIDEVRLVWVGTGNNVFPEAPITVGLDVDVIGLDYMEIDYIGTPPTLSQIIINTDLGEFSVEDMFLTKTDTAGTIKCSGNISGGVWINWRYADPTDLGDEVPQVYTFPLENIDTMRQSFLSNTFLTTPVLITDEVIEPFGLPLKKTGTGESTRWSKLTNLEGLALKTYQSDMFNNWLETEWIDGTNGIAEITSVDTTGNSFTIDALNLASKLYTLLNRVAMSDGTYKSWIETVYTSGGFWRAETPMYIGGLSKELVFQEVISNAETSDQPLGTLAGRGKLTNKHKGGHIIVKPDEIMYIMGIISITPRIDYSQGNTWDMNLLTMDDFHKPQLDGIGFQDLITDGMAYWDTTVDDEGNVTYKSAGKQPAWLNYMTNVNRTYGNFAIKNNEMFMTLNRRYEFDATDGIVDLTTYVDPIKFNDIFAQTDRGAQNFWVQIGADIEARRVMSAKVIPNL